MTAPPIDDRANVAACRTIAKAAGVPRSAVRVVRGARSRDKLVEIDAPMNSEELACLYR